MKNAVIAGVTFLLFAASESLVAAPHVKVSLAPLSPTTLAGIPIGFRVTIENIGTETIPLPREAFLVVRTESGESFEARTSELGEVNGRIEMGDWPEVPIKPGEKATLLIESNGTFGDPAWFRDRRLHKPGRYEIQMFVGTGVIGERPHTYHLPRLTASNFSEFRVLTPHSDDAAVWKAMEDFRERNVHRDFLARQREGKFLLELASRYSSSEYTGWILASGIGTDADETYRQLKQWLEIHSGKPYEDARWLIVARNEADRFARADDARALFHAKNVRDIVRRVMKPGQSHKLRRKADEILAELGNY